MNRLLRAIIGTFFVLVIVFSAISVCEDIGSSWKVDVTNQKLYTLSKGTKSILAKLNQPITVKLFYARTAALKGPDQIQYFNNYYEYVKSLLEEYVSISNGMVKLDVIDPRPFSDDEEQANIFLPLRRDLRRSLKEAMTALEEGRVGEAVITLDALLNGPEAEDYFVDSEDGPLSSPRSTFVSAVALNIASPPSS